MYKNYIFDLYGTLVDIHTDEENLKVWEKLAIFYSYYGAAYKPEEMRLAYQGLVNCKEGAKNTQEDYPEIQIENVFWNLFAAKGVEPNKELVLYAGQFFRILSTEYIRLYNGVVRMLKELQRQKKKLYILSNAQKIFTQSELYSLDIANYFDGIMLSSDYGVKKPDLRFFEFLFNKYQLRPEECIMIGNDVQSDIAGAVKAGMDSYYIHSNLSPECVRQVNATYVRMGMNMESILWGVTEL